jgi:hypothetical protein
MPPAPSAPRRNARRLCSRRDSHSGWVFRMRSFGMGNTPYGPSLRQPAIPRDHPERPGSRLQSGGRRTPSLPGTPPRKEIDMKRTIAGVAVIFTIGSASIAAQWPKYQAPGVPRDGEQRVRMDAPAPRTADGKPDFSGNWTGSGVRARSIRRSSPVSLATRPRLVRRRRRRRWIRTHPRLPHSGRWARTFPAACR